MTTAALGENKTKLNQLLSSINACCEHDMKAVDHLIDAQSHSEVELVSTIARYLIKSGGKRFRPKILLLCAQALGYTGVEHHEVACVIEFIHSATLLHDDVVDQSDLRRHAKSAHQVWGNEASVLVGDFLYSRAFQILAWRSNIPLMQLLAKTTAALAEGEVQQLVEIKNHQMSIEKYEQIIGRKTGAMFAAASQAGAIIAAPDHLLLHEHLYRYGKELGMAFQIIDDILDYQSNRKTLGKTIAKDFLEGKVTLPFILALRSANAEQRAFLESSIQSPAENQVTDVMAVMNALEVFSRAYQHAREHIALAQQSLNALPKNHAVDMLHALCTYAIERCC